MKTIYAEFQENGFLTDDFNYDSLLLEGEDEAIKIKAKITDKNNGNAVRAYIRTANGSGYIIPCYPTAYYSPATVTGKYTKPASKTHITINNTEFLITSETVAETLVSSINNADIGITASVEENIITLVHSGTGANDDIRIIGGKQIGFEAGIYFRTTTFEVTIDLKEDYMQKGTLRVGFEVYATNYYKRFEVIKLTINPFVDVSGGTGSSAGYAVTITAGEIEALAPTESPYVTNSGSDKDAVFDFGIPAGVTFTPDVDGNGNLSWTNDGNLPNPTTRNIKGLKGDTGAQGEQGVQGPTGADGKSAYEIAVDKGFSGTEAEWLASLKGVDGADGQDGTNGTNGTDGQDGADGFSPTATVTQTASGAVISITDKNGTTTATVSNGSDGQDGADGQNGTNGQDGYTPVKGTDYWTAADKAEITAYAKQQVTPTSVTVTLDKDDWDSQDNQTVLVTGVTATNTVVVSPSTVVAGSVSLENISYYQANKVVCTAQGSGTLTFYRGASVEDEDLYVNVLIYPESGAAV